MEMDKLQNYLHYQVTPPAFLVIFTCLPQVLTVFASGNDWNSMSLFGDVTSWAFFAVILVWAFAWLKVSSARVKGPPAPGIVPEYQDNGCRYYYSTVVTYLLVEMVFPGTSVHLYNKMPQLLATLNISAFALCLQLFFTGKSTDEDRQFSSLYIFYRGRTLHPSILGVDVKQLTNCRIGLIIWQLLILAFFIASLENGFSAPILITFLLQTAYLAKFFYWESGYFSTLDITLDRAGYYICWGCLVWVPSFYTFTSYYFVQHRPIMTNDLAGLIGFLGFVSLGLNYLIDAQKQLFRSTNGKCLIWGKKPNFIEAVASGRKSFLLTSGYWGIARHLNYTMELFLALFWSLPGLGLGLAPFFYFIYLTVLLVHRVFRDEAKCREKYGKYWSQYCSVVKYRMIPFIF